MITVISPAKSLDFETPAQVSTATSPDFLDQTAKIVQKMRGVSKKKMMDLMDISADLASLNVERYLHFESGVPVEKSKQALLAFDGDVYQGLMAKEMDATDLEFAQGHLRILSGLYGLLRPMDMIQPYRLEMGTKLPIGRRKNLYHFWEELVTQHLNLAIADSGSEVLLNLASQEYFGAVQPKALKARLVTPIFMDKKGADYKVVSFWAKKARGKMVAAIIHNRINAPEELKEMDLWGYTYNAGKSDAQNWIFTRDIPQP